MQCVSCLWVCYGLNDRNFTIKRWAGESVQMPADFFFFGDRADSSVEAYVIMHQLRFALLLRLCFYHSCWTSCGPVGVLFFQSQTLLRLAASYSDLMACWCPPPMFFRSHVVDVATNPLHPTSTESTRIRQLRCSASAALSVHFRLFLFMCFTHCILSRCC